MKGDLFCEFSFALKVKLLPILYTARWNVRALLHCEWTFSSLVSLLTAFDVYQLFFRKMGGTT